MAKYYWNDDTMSMSWKGVDFVCGDEIPEKYQEEEDKQFDKFCQNQQISSKKKVTFTEKKQAALAHANKVSDNLRTRNGELITKVKNLEKKVEDFEVSFSQLEVLEGHKAELEQIKAEKLRLEEAYKSLKENPEISKKNDEISQLSGQVKTLGDEKAGLELEIEELKAEQVYLTDAFEELEREKSALEIEDPEKSSKKSGKKGDK